MSKRSRGELIESLGFDGETLEPKMEEDDELKEENDILWSKLINQLNNFTYNQIKPKNIENIY